MKKSILIVALACAMVFSFAAVAAADHSPQFYFNFQAEDGVVQSPAFKLVFPASFDVTFTIDNGSWADGTASPHSNYSQNTAKCGVCHSVHRAPTTGTASTATPTVSSRYTLSEWAAGSSDTQLLLKSSANGACSYCHISSGPTKMYGGDATLALFGESENSWNEFYGHTTGCTSCHAVHGAKTFGGGAAAYILKYEGIKKLSAVPLVVQPEVYTNSPLYASWDDMIAGIVKPDALTAGVTAKDAAVTAQCSTCHANYSPKSNQVINPTYTNPNLFQPASWALANGSSARIELTSTVTSLPGVPGITYTSATSSAGSLIMSYRNHPMTAANAVFSGAGASAGVKGLIPVSGTAAYTCTSCHNADRIIEDTNGATFGGEYLISSFPHYTPGYYKFMKALDQTQFDTPATLAELNLGREGFFNSGFGTARPGKPAVMNDGYCTKCHTTVGIDY